MELTGGFKTKWQVEIDSFCRRILSKHWPHVHRCGDVREFPDIDDYGCDVICGGFPCQPVSCAGQRKGNTDERWLWDEMRRICEIVRPKWLLAENVRGLLSADDGRLFGGILRDLARIGYCAEWSLFSACTVGAPHSRERLFILAYPYSDGLQGGIGWSTKGSGTQEILSQIRDARTGPRFDVPTSRFCRGSDGIPYRIQRTACLGNAVVPQVSKWIGYRILEIEYGSANVARR